MKKKILILLGVIIIIGAGFFIYRYYSDENIVIDPNISKEYQAELENELSIYADKLLEKPDDVELYIKIGVTEHKLGRLSDAERTFKKALDFPVGQSNYLIYLYLGRVYRDMEKFDKADEMLRISTQINPNTDVGFLELIDLYKKHYPCKADELDNIYHAASDFAQSPEIWASYAQFLEDRREYREAWIYWQEVVRVEPENADAIMGVVRMEEMLGIDK